MKTQKLSLHDFEAVETKELLAIKGRYMQNDRGDALKDMLNGSISGSGGGSAGAGGCAGDADGFGGTYDMDEVVVTAQGIRYYPNTNNSAGTNGGYVGTAVAQAFKRVLGVPTTFFKTDALGNPDHDANPGGLAFSSHPTYVDPSSNC